MPGQKIPIQSGERTGIVSGGFAGFIAAAFAVIAHAIDVVTGGGVGFGGHDAAVAVLAHAERVRQRYPVDGVDEHRHMPLMEFAGYDAQQ